MPPAANTTPPKQPQLPAQPAPNPNSAKPSSQQQRYSITLNDIHLRSGTTLASPQQPIIMEVDDTNIESVQEPTNVVSPTAKKPPFPSRLTEQVFPNENQVALDFLDQLKQMTVKIPFLDAIKEVPIYSKAIKEVYVKTLGRKKKDPKTIHVLGQLSDLMLDNPRIPKYADLGSPVVTLTIQGIRVHNILIDLGESINVMTKEVTYKLNIIGLRQTPTILQLANSSTIVPDGMLEDVIVTLHSWDYPVDFVVLSPKTSTGGYPIILG